VHRSNGFAVVIGELRFGGPGREIEERQSPSSLNPSEFEIVLAKYAAWHFAARQDLPDREFLRTYDRFALVPRLRADWSWAPITGGQTLRELYVGAMLTFLDAPRMQVSSRFSGARIGPGISPQTLAPTALAQEVLAQLPPVGNPDGPGALAAMFDGEYGHVVALSGANRDTARIQFRDPWRGESLLSAARGSRAAAVRDPEHVDAWYVTPASLAPVLVAVLWPPKSTRANLERTLGEADAYLAGALRWVESFPGSRMATVAAGHYLAELLELRGHTQEALVWRRQAAVVSGHGELLACRLDNASLERRYWRRLSQLTASGGNPWAMPDEEPPPDRPYVAKQAEDHASGDEMSLACDLANGGRFAEAKRLFVRVREIGTVREAAMANLFLGQIWLSLEAPQVAIGPLTAAATSTNLAILGTACARLGDAHWECNQLDWALLAYERGAFSGDSRVTQYCALQAGKIIAGTDESAAQRYYEFAAVGSDEETRARAQDLRRPRSPGDAAGVRPAR